MDNIVTTGTQGLDYILRGGLPQGSSIILEGTPGCGKTTLAFQFLYHGIVNEEEPGIYITFEELPSQIYNNMLAFNWDLRQLEKQNKLRVICLSPETLFEEMVDANGLFEQMVHQIGCKRVVIDSISLFKYGIGNEESHRKIIYKLCNILRRMELTALLIREQSNAQLDITPFEHFVADGVIRLSIQKQLDRYRERVLEVLKMRGRSFIEGEHVYRIKDEGIHLIPSLYVLQKGKIDDGLHRTTTGIAQLDYILSGGIPKGSVFMFDTNSKADYKHLFGSIVSNRLLAGEKAVILPSSISTLNSLQKLYTQHGVDVDKCVEQEGLYFVEHYNRSFPSNLASSVIDVSKMDDIKFKEHIREVLGPIMQSSLEQGDSWFIYYDMNTIISERGKDFVTRYFAEEAANARSYGITLLVLCNFKEIGEETASFLERTSDGVIRTWVDRTYQYLQVTKSPGGKVSEIYIVEHIDQKPFVRLV